MGSKLRLSRFNEENETPSPLFVSQQESSFLGRSLGSGQSQSSGHPPLTSPAVGTWPWLWSPSHWKSFDKQGLVTENRCCFQLESRGLSCRWKSVELPHRGSAGPKPLCFVGIERDPTHRCGHRAEKHLEGSFGRFTSPPPTSGCSPHGRGNAAVCPRMEVPPTNWPNYGTD